ncbi:sensor histidine kinase [Streptomyces sp. NPDC097107]|uniref:sensor histidine kinase n=1 Tax=Streptomyces sp. NPDC097107 TaxID=3366089 RepID=UPI00382A524A
MDAPPRLTGQSGAGLLEAVVGEGFAVALQDGLTRSAAGFSGSRDRARSRRVPPRPGVLARPASRGTAQSVLLPAESAAVLRRFEAALPALLHDRGADAATPVPVLLAYARRVLREAARAQDRPAGDAPPGTPGPGAGAPCRRTGPAAGSDCPETAAVSSLLMECAVLHVLEGDDGSGTAPARAAGLTRTLGRVIRADTASVRSADRHPDRLWHERRRIARDLHDELGTSLELALRRLESHAAGAADPEGHLAAVGASLREATGHTRGLVEGLRTQTAVPPLEQAVRRFSTQAAPASVTVSVATGGDERLVPDAWRFEVFLVVRECLRNAFTHAGADRVAVASRVTRRWMYVRVEDDGAGFDPAHPLPSGRPGHGLGSMSERLAEIGGRITVRGTPGTGTRVDIHVPLRPQSA